jgi:hypothetical protein
MAEYSAYAVIGCKINLDDIPSIIKTVKAFEHNFPLSTKFDSQTGKPLWREDSYPKYTFYSDGREDERSQPIDKKGLKTYQGTDGEPLILGFGVGEDTYSNGGDDYGFRNLPDVNEIKEKLKAVLEPLDMWSEINFGLYAVLHCSY